LDAADAADAADERAEEATERADDTPDEAALLIELVRDAREFDMDADELGAVAVAEPLPLPVAVPERAVLPPAVPDDEGGAEGAPTVNAELLVRISEALDALTRERVYDPGETSCGKSRVNELLCKFTLFAIARPPAKVWLLSALKIERTAGDVSEESDDQVTVTFWSGVAVEGTCRLDTAAAVATNARTAVA